jgi:Circularly permutated YpsA SLOG family
MTLKKIISGGQTGVDRGALDAALEAKFPCGGWCPADRAAEDGAIATHYPLTPLARGGYRARTRQNVLDSDGTAILYRSTLTGGSLLTLNLCQRAGKAHCLIDAARTDALSAGMDIARFVDAHSIQILNVAGPRASGWPQGHEFVLCTIRALLQR